MRLLPTSSWTSGAWITRNNVFGWETGDGQQSRRMVIPLNHGSFLAEGPERYKKVRVHHPMHNVVPAAGLRAGRRCAGGGCT